MSLLQITIHLLVHWGVASILFLKKHPYKKSKSLFDYQKWDIWFAPISITIMWLTGMFITWFIVPTLTPMLNQPNTRILSIFMNLFLFVGLALLYRKATKQGFLLLGFYKDQLCFRLTIGLKWCIGYLIVSRVLPLILAFLFISEGKFNQFILGQSIEPSGNIAKQLEYFEKSAGMLSLSFVISYLIFFKVLFEEFIFRGLLYGPIRRKIGPWPAMLISSLLFTLAHGFLHPFLLIPGFLFAYLYEQTQSLIPSVVFHSMVNLVSVIQYFYIGTALPYFQFQTQIAGVFLGLIILIILLEWLFRWQKHNGATLRIPHSILQLS